MGWGSVACRIVRRPIASVSRGLIGRDELRSLTGCYRRDCVSLVSGCCDAVSVLTDRDAVAVRESCRIVSDRSPRFAWFLLVGVNT
jgi:hypothetical protein